MRAHCFEQCIRDQSVDDRTHPQRHHIHRPALVQVIQGEDLLACLNRTRPIRQPLGRRAVKVLAVQGVRGQVGDRVFDRREMINALKNVIDVQAHHTAEDRRDGEQSRCHVDGEAHMREERAEHDAH